jgi:hypothetical protein
MELYIYLVKQGNVWIHNTSWTPLFIEMPVRSLESERSRIQTLVVLILSFSAIFFIGV